MFRSVARIHSSRNTLSAGKLSGFFRQRGKGFPSHVANHSALRANPERSKRLRRQVITEGATAAVSAVREASAREIHASGHKRQRSPSA